MSGLFLGGIKMAKLSQSTISEIQKKASQGTALVSSTPEKQKIYDDYLKSTQPKAPTVTTPKASTSTNSLAGLINNQNSGSTYSTPDVYQHSGNVKSFDNSGQQTSSVSGYQGATTPSFTASSNVTNLLNNIKNQESQMKTIWNSNDTTGSYNTSIAERNKMTGQLLDMITKESGGNASLGDIESILGRRLENQEMQNYREQFSGGTTLQQQQLNNLWEHDFATRNNGEHYQYVNNYLQNGTGGEVLGQSMLGYLNGMSAEDKAKYGQGMTTSLGATQNYFDQRATGWTPDYVNNTVNPKPWGEIDAADMIDNGGVQNQKNIENYQWMLNNPNYDYTTMQPSPLDQQGMGGGMPQQAPQQGGIGGGLQAPQQGGQESGYQAILDMMNQQKAEEEARRKKLEQDNAYKQSEVSGLGNGGMQMPKASDGHTYAPGQTANSTGYSENKSVNSNAYTKYLQNVFSGGF